MKNLSVYFRLGLLSLFLLLISTSCSKEEVIEDHPKPQPLLAITERVGDDLHIKGAGAGCSGSYKDMMACCDHTTSTKVCAIVIDYYNGIPAVGNEYDVSWFDADGNVYLEEVGTIVVLETDGEGNPEVLEMSF